MLFRVLLNEEHSSFHDDAECLMGFNLTKVSGLYYIEILEGDLLAFIMENKEPIKIAYEELHQSRAMLTLEFM